jgi:hypothetical protein
MLQYGKPINKDIKSIDLKIECPCLSLAIAPVFAAAFCLFPAVAVLCVGPSVNERLLFDRQT